MAQIPADEQISSVGGDGAFDTRKCHAAIAARHAQAIIPVRRNGRMWEKDGLGIEARNEMFIISAYMPRMQPQFLLTNTIRMHIVLLFNSVKRQTKIWVVYSKK